MCVFERIRPNKIELMDYYIILLDKLNWEILDELWSVESRTSGFFVFCFFVFFSFLLCFFNLDFSKILLNNLDIYSQIKVVNCIKSEHSF